MPVPAAFIEALGTRYAIEREIGRGGMASVYLARDLRHHRLVAVKVLYPEVAHALGESRFRREIELAGRLRHPHILPLHDSGEAAGLLYYVMPYVAGESLRARLAREHQLPIDEVLKITSQVASALTCAHEQGILHRDIKPENILLESGEAVVADFGIARSVAGDEHMTSTGISLGTPAYMSPEQATGQRDLDARTDVYSLGCVAYEMLAGEPPFTGPTPQAILGKRLSGGVPPLHIVRETVPPEVEWAVERALARAPADRFPTAARFSEALERATQAASQAVPPSARPSARRAVRLAVIAGLVAVAIAGLSVLLLSSARRADRLSSAPGMSPHRLLVADFENATRDTSLGWVSAEVMRMELGRLRAVRLLPMSDVRQTLIRMGRTDPSHLDLALAREVAIRDGVPAVVAGKVLQVGSGFVLSAQLLRADSGTAMAEAGARAADSSALLPALTRLARDLAASLAGSGLTEGAPLAAVTTDSLSALRKYTQAVRDLEWRGDFATAGNLLRQAVAIDPRFASAWARLATALNGAEAVAAVTKAYELRATLPERQRHLVEAGYHQMVTGDVDRQIAAFQAILAVDPTDGYALHNLGDLYKVHRDYAAAEPLLRRAAERDPPFAVTFLSLINVQFARGEFAAAESTFARLIERGPTAEIATMFRAALSAGKGDLSRAESILIDAEITAAAEPAFLASVRLDLASVLATGGRFEEARRLREQVVSSSQVGVSPVFRLHAIVDQLSADAGLDPSSVGLRRRLAEFLADSSYRRLDPLQRPDLDLAQLLAETGMVREAQSVLRRYTTEVEPGLQPFDRRQGRVQRAVVQGYLDLSRKRPDLAVVEFRRANALSFSPLDGLPELGQAYEQVGQPDSALAVYLRYVTTPFLFRNGEDALYLGKVYERLGELYERRGEGPAAAAYFERIVALYGKGDAGAQPALRRARNKLRVLKPAPR